MNTRSMRWYELPDLPEDFAAVLGERQRAFSDCGTQIGLSPIQRAWEHQLVRAAKLGTSQGWDAEHLDAHLAAAQNLLSGLSFSLNSGKSFEDREKAEKSGLLYCEFEPGYFENKRFTSCPIHKGSLDGDLHDYFATSSLSCGAFDWLFVNAYLRFYIEDLYENLMTGSIFMDVHWSYFLSGGRPLTMAMIRSLGSLLRIIFKWFVIPAAAVYAYYTNHSWWALGIAIFFGISVIWGILSIPDKAKKRKEAKRFAQAIEEMMTLKYYSGALLWNPTDLMNRVHSFEAKYPDVYLTPVTSILARAIDREPHILAMELVEGCSKGNAPD